MKLLFLLLLGTPAFAFVEDGGFHPEPCPTQLNNTVVKSLSITNNAQNELERNSIANGE